MKVFQQKYAPEQQKRIRDTHKTAYLHFDQTEVFHPFDGT